MAGPHHPLLPQHPPAPPFHSGQPISPAGPCTSAPMGNGWEAPLLPEAAPLLWVSLLLALPGAKWLLGSRTSWNAARTSPRPRSPARSQGSNLAGSRPVHCLCPSLPRLLQTAPTAARSTRSRPHPCPPRTPAPPPLPELPLASLPAAPSRPCLPPCLPVARALSFPRPTASSQDDHLNSSFHLDPRHTTPRLPGAGGQTHQPQVKLPHSGLTAAQGIPSSSPIPPSACTSNSSPAVLSDCGCPHPGSWQHHSWVPKRGRSPSVHLGKIRWAECGPSTLWGSLPQKEANSNPKTPQGQP